jgi:5-enolpyruvylshikimate-3-phosphate synthase
MAELTLGAGRLAGSICAPPSKSMAHRGLILSMLSGGTVSPVCESRDIAATRRCMETLLNKEKDFYCDESGSTLRFMIPLTLALNGGGCFHRADGLKARPIGIYEELLSDAVFSKGEPLSISGQLKSGVYTLSGAVSSQFITGLLLALPLLEGNSEIHVTEPFESMPYVALTLQAMAAFGVTVHKPDACTFLLSGGQVYKPCDFHIEGDYSQAAVFLCARALGQDITVTNLNPDSLQADRVILDIIRNRPHVVDAAQCPDIIPLAAMVLCLTEGHFTIENAGRLRLKECDRLNATASLLKALGADIALEGDNINITGVKGFEGGVKLDCLNDHRMAMMLSIAALYCEKPITLMGTECVNKSWPTYFDTYFQLGGKAL